MRLLKNQKVVRPVKVKLEKSPPIMMSSKTRPETNRYSWPLKNGWVFQVRNLQTSRGPLFSGDMLVSGRVVMMFHQSLGWWWRDLASILSLLRYCGSVKGAPEVVAKHGPVRNMTEILCFFQDGCLGSGSKMFKNVWGIGGWGWLGLEFDFLLVWWMCWCFEQRLTDEHF